MGIDHLRVGIRARGPRVQILRAAGPLGLGTVSVLRAAAEKALVEQPDLLVVDLSGAVLRDRLAARVLPLISARASVWPVTRIAIAGAPHEIEQSLRLSSGLSPLTWFPDTSAAMRAAPQRRTVARVALPERASAAKAARRVFTTFGPEVEDLRERAEIIVTELVANAVTHARGPIELRIAYTGRVHISVLDGEPDLPVNVDDGYGFDLVRRFAAAWGWQPVAGGKVVWAVVGRAPRTRRSVRLTCSP